MNPEIIAVMIPIVALFIPIVVVLTKHQQRMAELIHGGQKDNQQFAILHYEIQELKQLVHQQTLQIDNLRSLGPGTPPKE
ncbi:MAG: hypothetical protein ABL949_00680 [Fimbriimonadaceae bacterium]